MNDLDTMMATRERHRQAYAKTNKHNKATVFDALGAAGITAVNVSFDGEGDSGQVNSSIAYLDDQAVEMPKGKLAVQGVIWGDTERLELHPPTASAA